MQKDIIYIDVDDDITAIIGKIKDAEHKIVALVPPKRMGTLQSAVNLRLIARSALQHNKRLVIITNNQALMALSASAKIPIARTLQSKPEIPEIPALEIDDGEDVIDGTRVSDTSGPGMAESIETPREDSQDMDTPTRATDTAASPATTVAASSVDKPKSKPKVTVPNFDSFRKRLLLGGVAAVLVIVFLVWAVFVAPSATVLISAKTSESSMSSKVTLADSANTDFAAGTIKLTTTTSKKDVSVAFDATGKKEVGEKAKGTITFSNCESNSPVTIPAGTGISALGVTYITQTDVVVPGGAGFLTCTTPGKSESVGVLAQDIGENYNADVGTTFSVAGHTAVPAPGYFRATATTAISGGSRKQITVVSSDDVQKATDQLKSQGVTAVRDQLAKQLGDNAIVMADTFTVDTGAASSSPAVDAEATSGKAKLTGSVSYSLSGVTRTDVSKYLDAYFAKQLSDNKNRRMYENGAKRATFINITKGDKGFAATLNATGTVGPKIEDAYVKNIAKGKRYGDIQSALMAIGGVDDVDVKFAPFWVRTAPNNIDKINVVFSLSDGS